MKKLLKLVLMALAVSQLAAHTMLPLERVNAVQTEMASYDPQIMSAKILEKIPRAQVQDDAGTMMKNFILTLAEKLALPSVRRELAKGFFFSKVEGNIKPECDTLIGDLADSIDLFVGLKEPGQTVVAREATVTHLRALKNTLRMPEMHECFGATEDLKLTLAKAAFFPEEFKQKAKGNIMVIGQAAGIYLALRDGGEGAAERAAKALSSTLWQTARIPVSAHDSTLKAIDFWSCYDNVRRAYLQMPETISTLQRTLEAIAMSKEKCLGDNKP